MNATLKLNHTAVFFLGRVNHLKKEHMFSNKCIAQSYKLGKLLLRANILLKLKEELIRLRAGIPCQSTSMSLGYSISNPAP